MKYARYFCAFLLILMVAAITSAQDDTVEFSDGTTLTLSGDWVVAETTADYTQISSDQVEVFVTFYFYTSDVLSGERISEASAFAEYDYNFYDVSQAQPFSADNMRDSEVAGLPAVEYTFQGDKDGKKYDITVIYFLTADGAGITAEVSPYNLSTKVDFDEVYKILNTVSKGSSTGRKTNTPTPLTTDGETLTLVDNSTLVYPTDWSVANGDTADTLFLDNPSGTGFITVIVDPGFGGIEEFNTPEKFLAWRFKNTFKETFDKGAVQSTDIAGFPAAIYDFATKDRTKDVNIRMVVILLPNTNMLTAFIRDDTDYDAMVADSMPILASLQASDTIFCFVGAPSGVNLRSKPSTSGSVVRKISNSDGEYLTADYASIDGAGVAWFHLVEDDAFVRQDVVFYDNNSCGNLPVK